MDQIPEIKLQLTQSYNVRDNWPTLEKRPEIIVNLLIRRRQDALLLDQVARRLGFVDPPIKQLDKFASYYTVESMLGNGSHGEVFKIRHR